MFALLALFASLQRVKRLRAVLLPALLTSVGLACFLILTLVLWLGAPQGGSAASGGALTGAPNVALFPVSTITWQPASYVGVASGDLAPAMHPTDPMRALLGGPLPIRYTTDGGSSWHDAAGLNGLGQGVPVWLPGGGGQAALQVSLSQSTPLESLTPGPTGNALNISRSSDSGVHWSAPITMTIPGIAENLPYLWADANPASPYYGRIYLTLTMLDAARTGAFDTVGILYSSDQGATWSTPVGLVDPTEFAQGTNYNAFASAAIQPNGGVVVAWHRGTCCRTISNVPNNVMWSRSTDGGVTFPVSGTIAAVPITQSLEYNSLSPGGYFRWNPAPNITADPVDSTLYAVWVAYSQPNMPESARIYLSRSTDNGSSWSAPVVVDNNGPYIFQFVPWVQVSPDHVVHVTYQAATSVVDVIAHFYIQSTDRGATWSTPFALSLSGHINGAVQGDFQASSTGGYNGSQGTILTSWEDELGTGVRVGTFPLVSNTPTATATATATATCAPAGTPGPWAVGANYPLGLTDIAVASDGTTVYGFGGRDASGRHTQAYKYGFNGWVPIASVPDAIGEAEAEYGHNGKVYVIWYVFTFIYDIATDSWSSGAPPPQSVAYVGHAYWNGKIYVIGGLVSDASNAVYFYDIATDSWSTLAPLPQAEYGMAAAAINGKIYGANGQTAGGGPTNNLYIYDIATNSWSQGASSPLASALPGGAAIGGKLYMIGGQVEGQPNNTNTYLYDPASNSWSQGPSLNIGRYGGNAATIDTPGGQTSMVVGGFGANFWLNSVEASTEPLAPCATPSATATVTPPANTPTAMATATATCSPSGGWNIVHSPSQGTGDNLLGVAAISANDIWAVGWYGSGGAFLPLTEHWDGSSWTAVASPGNALLYGVAAVSSNDVWAVGGYSNGAGSVILHWDGSSWSQVPSPKPGAYDTLNGVVAISANDVWAVGWYSVNNTKQTLTLHWDGSSWSQIASPNVNSVNVLQAVSAASSDDVWAVGYYWSFAAYREYLTLHWNGSSWSVVPNPNTGGTLYGVAAISANDVWAVGSAEIEHWNGASWTAFPNPAGGILWAVTAISSNDVWAVGAYGSGSGTAETVHWNGSSWVPVAIPSPGGRYNEPMGVAAVSSNDVWAVGWYDDTNTGYQYAFTERYTASPCTTATGTPTLLPTLTPTVISTVSVTNSPTRTSTATPPSSTAVSTATSTSTSVAAPPTATSTLPPTATAKATATACTMTFSDVPPGSTFYPYIMCLACRGIVNGYSTSPPCTTGTPCFRPSANVTRGQMSKFASNAAGYSDSIPPDRQTFTDVPPNSTFWLSIERAYLHNVIRGYTDPSRCPTGTPCFLPGGSVTRGQTAKFVSNAAGYSDSIPPNRQTFTDVPPFSTFWLYIERVNLHGIVNGYTTSPPCTTGIPCFLSGNSVTRGQTAKFISNAFFPNCSPPR